MDINQDNQKIMNNRIQKFKDQQKKKSEQIKDLFSNTSYIDWLINFSEEYHSFSDYNLIYCKNLISQTDNCNIKALNIFYEGIENYAKQNYIYPTSYINEVYYKVSYNNIGFEVGIVHGQEYFYFCRRCNIDKEDEFINLNDIMINKKQDNVDYITDTLNELSEMIISLHDRKIPIKAIKNTLDKAINEIIWQEKDKNKILIKKEM